MSFTTYWSEHSDCSHRKQIRKHRLMILQLSIGLLSQFCGTVSSCLISMTAPLLCSPGKIKEPYFLLYTNISQGYDK